MNSKLRDKRGRLTAYAFIRGYTEQCGEHVTVSFDHAGFYVAKRSIYGKGGYKKVTRKTLEGIRMAARDMSR